MPATHNTSTSDDDRPGVNLVLGSGAARGLAHIGAVRWLVEHDIRINAIAGSSMGALVGGLHAAGKLDEFERWVSSLSRLDIAGMIDVSWDRSGMIRGDRLIEKLRSFTGDIDISQLPIPYTAVAVDLNTQSEVWICEGSLYDAIRASISIPAILTPVTTGAQVLVDGGLLAPLPMAAITPHRSSQSQSQTKVVAIDVCGASRLPPQPPNPGKDTAEQDNSPTWYNSLTQWMRSDNEEQQPSHERFSAIDVISESLDITQAALTRVALATYPPDVLLQSPRNLSGLFDFHKAAELIEHGYALAETARDKINPE